MYLQPKGRYGRFTIEWDEWARAWLPRPVPDSERSILDIALEVGYQFYTDAQCGNCGVPFWYGYSEHQEVNFEVKSMTCHSCAALEKDRKAKEEKEGERRRVEPTGFYYEETGLSIPLPPPLEALAKVP